jgi:hypothetical protein
MEPYTGRPFTFSDVSSSLRRNNPGKIHPFLLMDVAATAANLKPTDAAGSTAVYFNMVDRFRHIHRRTRASGLPRVKVDGDKTENKI